MNELRELFFPSLTRDLNKIIGEGSRIRSIVLLDQFETQLATRQPANKRVRDRTDIATNIFDNSKFLQMLQIH